MEIELCEWKWIDVNRKGEDEDEDGLKHLFKKTKM